MSAMAYQIIGASIVYSTVCSGADQRNHQRSPVTGEFPAQRANNGKTFPFDDVIVRQEKVRTWEYERITVPAFYSERPPLFSSHPLKELS